MRHPLLRFIAAVIVAWTLTRSTSFAQMGYSACSLEWLVADSDVAVRASVVRVDRTPVVHAGDGVPGDPEVWKTVTLRVHETLRGEPAGSLIFVERTYAYNRIYEAWRDAGREQLWFLVRSERRDDGDGAAAKDVATLNRFTRRGVIRLGAPVPEERHFTPMPPPIFAMNLNVLRRPNDILDAARAAVAEGGERVQVKAHAIELPRGVMQRSGSSGDVNHLTVPSDQRLEKLGHRLIEAPGVFLAKAELVYADRLRLEGVKILRHFPTEEHIVLLKSLLDDPVSSIHVSPEGTKEKVYDIREAAYEALHSWDIDVSKPVLREDPPKP